MVYEQSPFEHTHPHNDCWVYRVSATVPSNQAVGTHHLLNCGNNGYDKGCRENHDGHTKNRTVIPAIDVEAMIRYSLMTAVAVYAWGIKAVSEQGLPPLQRDDA